MRFKDSAFIFVTGFVLFAIGAFINAIGISGSIVYGLTSSMYSSSSNSGAVAVTAFGSLLVVIGLIQMSMGAFRALSKIDALPVPAAGTAGPVPAVVLPTVSPAPPEPNPL